MSNLAQGVNEADNEIKVWRIQLPSATESHPVLLSG
jgi:hypothetical protein